MAKKETYYFRHDFTPTADPKIEAMLANYGAAGYGLYWKIVEMLHSDAEHKLPTKQYIMIAIAKQMHSTPEFVLAFINDCINLFELFKQERDMIYCDRVFRNISDREEKTNTARANAKARWDATALQKNATALQSDAIKGNKSKVKESKGDKKEINRMLDFETFWNAYGKKHDRDKCLKKFTALSDDIVAKILLHVPRYVLSTPDIQFRKNPLTYITGKCWDDEIDVKKDIQLAYIETDRDKW